MNMLTGFLAGSLALAGLLLLALGYRYWKLSQAARKEQAERHNLKTIFEKANDGVLVVDIADGSIIRVNHKLARMLGYEKEQLEQMAFFQLPPEEKMDRSSEVIVETWEEQGMVFEDLPFVKADGEQLPVECSAKVFSYGQHPAILIYARDIRERLRMERQIREQNEMIEKKNRAIMDSINYAKRIQDAIHPPKKALQSIFEESFILYKPRDVVSGDFFWFDTVQKEGTTYDIVAAADCTGHGVPGGFMSMIGHTLLNNIVLQQGVVEPAEILNQLRARVISYLQQEAEGMQMKDGMDIALCTFQRQQKVVHFAGAHNPLFIFREDGSFEEVKANPFPIGRYLGKKKEERFTEESVEIAPGDTLYMFSDGFPDQFGSASEQAEKRSTGFGKKYTLQRFKKCLADIQDYSMTKQQQLLDEEFRSWKGQLEQLDDVLIVGLRCS